jgi:hypothetical protein
MDEEDGRPGHVAQKSGHMNAHAGVPAVSMFRTSPKNQLLRPAIQPKKRCSFPPASDFHESRGRSQHQQGETP